MAIFKKWGKGKSAESEPSVPYNPPSADENSAKSRVDDMDAQLATLEQQAGDILKRVALEMEIKQKGEEEKKAAEIKKLAEEYAALATEEVRRPERDKKARDVIERLEALENSGNLAEEDRKTLETARMALMKIWESAYDQKARIAELGANPEVIKAAETKRAGESDKTSAEARQELPLRPDDSRQERRTDTRENIPFDQGVAKIEVKYQSSKGKVEDIVRRLRESFNIWAKRTNQVYELRSKLFDVERKILEGELMWEGVGALPEFLTFKRAIKKCIQSLGDPSKSALEDLYKLRPGWRGTKDQKRLINEVLEQLEKAKIGDVFEQFRRFSRELEAAEATIKELSEEYLRIKSSMSEQERTIKREIGANIIGKSMANYASRLDNYFMQEVTGILHAQSDLNAGQLQHWKREFGLGIS